MGKRPHYNDEDPEMETLRREMATLNRRMEEVITILGGNSSYDVKGVRADVKDLKIDVASIRGELESMKRDTAERRKNEGFLNIRLETIPQKIAGVIAFLAVLISVVQGFKTLFTQTP